MQDAEQITISSLAELDAFALSFSQRMKPGQTVALVGELGAGKTTFTRALLKALGYSQPVSSPTFVLQHEYVLPSKQLVEHWDLYRLQQIPAELLETSARGTIRLVEWANRDEKWAAKCDWVVTIVFGQSSESRIISVGGRSVDPFL